VHLARRLANHGDAQSRETSGRVERQGGPEHGPPSSRLISETRFAEGEEHIMHANIRGVLAAVALTAVAPSAFANVVTDWDEKAVAVVTPMSSLGGTSQLMQRQRVK
jgi:hypothetical protein